MVSNLVPPQILGVPESCEVRAECTRCDFYPMASGVPILVGDGDKFQLVSYSAPTNPYPKVTPDMQLVGA